MTMLYGAIDLHSTNLVLALLDGDGEPVLQERLRCDVGVVARRLEPYREQVAGIAVESTPNWYWLADGLKAAGYKMRLAHPAGNKPYEGLKHGDDFKDARWLAELLRLGLLHEGYILSPERRAVRDLLRKRSHLVRERTRHLLSVGNLVLRNTGKQMRGGKLMELNEERLERMGMYDEQVLSVMASVRMAECLSEQIDGIEQAVVARVGDEREIHRLRSVPGIGRILGWTILLETGPIDRFAKAGNYASYCRCVKSERLSNDRKKGTGNKRNGNKYLAWAFLEAAHHAAGSYAPIRRWYQRRAARSLAISAKKAVACKLAKACYYILRDGVAFDMDKAF